jgi:hypothetical protein
MVSGAKSDLFHRSLNRLATNANQNHADRQQVLVFNFDPLVPTGCDYHPGFEDHYRLAFQLEAFLSPIVTKLKKPQEAIMSTIKVD